MKEKTLANQIAKLVAEKGGRAYYVGGCVRDKLMERPSTDIDIEIHGLAPDAVTQILDTLGKRIEIGKSFGIYALKGYALDIALPRRERPTGNGHRDFDVQVDPYIGTLGAAKRRDFTIGALMEDVLTGQIIDHFGGIQDIKQRTLRHVDDQTFAEDPLRVLRAAQFAARFEFDIHPSTLELCKGISLSTLSKERVLEETKKALLKADRPSLYFENLRQMDQLDIWFRELQDLIGVPQNPQYHAEGDVWNHTMMVVDEAAAVQNKAQEPFAFMLSALCHDFGKAVSTTMRGGKIHSYNHERQGIPLVKTFLSRLTNEHKLHHYVLNAVELHMRPNALAAQNSSLRATNKLFDVAFCPADLILLASADDRGRKPSGKGRYEPYLTQRLEQYKALIARPKVEGNDLIAAGLTPDKNFSKLLDYAHKLHLNGTDKDSALRQTLAYYKELNK